MTAISAYKVTMDALYFSGVRTLLDPLLGGVGAILMLHRIGEPPSRDFAPNDHLSVSPSFLDKALGALSRRFDFVSLDEAARRLSAGERGGRRFLAITLDDGYRDNLVAAAPIFRKHGTPYTIFIAPGLVDGTATLWWEDLEAAIAARQRFSIQSPHGPVEFDVSTPGLKYKAYKELLAFLTTGITETEQRRIVADLCWQVGHDCEAHRAASIMNWREIAGLSADPLCSFGAHTIGHYAVARLDMNDARREIAESGRVLEMETGVRPRHFAFPYGYPAAAGARDFALVRDAGFATAVTTCHGVLYPKHRDHLHALPRISLNGRFQRVRHIRTMLSGTTGLLANKGRLLNVH